MKKIWKMKKSKEAVSPVIATILMVAITVVLAAVLYVMVMGFGSNPDNNPTMSLSKGTTQSAHQEKILVASISDPQDLANMKISMVIGSSVFTATVAAAPAWTPLATFPATCTVTFVDIASDGKVSSGDYFLVTGPTPAGTTMVFNMLWGSENSNIASETWTTF
jgi:flagellin-like protein